MDARLIISKYEFRAFGVWVIWWGWKDRMFYCSRVDKWWGFQIGPLSIERDCPIRFTEE